MARCLLGLVLLLGLGTPALAQRLPGSVVPGHYDLALDVDLAAARFTGVEKIHVNLAEPMRRIVLHAVEIDIESVSITAGGAPQTAAVALHEPTQTATLTVPRTLPAGPAEIDVRYRGRLNDDLRGFYLSRANDRRYAVTQLESTDARRAFPSFDEPAFKATFSVSVTIDERDTAISNGRVIADVPGPAPGRHTLTFERTPKMSTYLVALAVGDFQCLSDTVDGTPIRICATPGKERLGEVAMDAARQIFPYLNAYYSIRYPFQKLDIVAVPDFAAGAMENTGAIFYREVELLTDPATASVGNRKRIWTVLAHEMAHQWFGDLVTMAWWNDLWLNEGFATWMETRPLAALKPEWNIAVDEAAATQAAMNLDGLGATRPIRAAMETPGEIEAAFDAISYEKSAAVIRMIEGWVGTDAFRRGVNAYLSRHSYGNATAEDFWTAMTSVTGQPVDRVLGSYVNRPGVPLVSVTGSCEDRDRPLRIAQRRFFEQPPRSAVADGLWQVPLCQHASSGAACAILNARTATLTCPAEGAPFLNAQARGYYRTEYSREMLASLARDIQTALSPAERLALLGDEWALVRAGRHTAADYLTLSVGFAGERSSGVLDHLADDLGSVYSFTAPADRPAFERFVRTLLQPALREVGFDARSDDGEERRSLRTTLVSTLGTIGGDETVIAQARAAVDRALTLGEPLEPTLARALLSVAAPRGDAALWDALLDAACKAQSPAERERYLFALTLFRSPELIGRTLQLTLGDEIRSQDTARVLARLLNNPAAGARTWAFIKRNWKDLESRLTNARNGATLSEGLAGLCDAGLRSDVSRFLTANPLPGTGRGLDHVLERIASCIAVRERESPNVRRWLASRQ